jgi:DNA polymerase I-like protein with 3'-5' exonuclease and polymerase domains
VLNLPSGLPYVALDTETSGLHPDDGARVACVALAYRDWYLALPFDQGVRDKFAFAQETLDLFNTGDPNLPLEDWEQLLRWLQDQRLTFQNAKFDLMMMRVGTRHWPGVDLIDNLFWDTMLASGVLDPTEARGLDATCARLGIGTKVGIDAVKDWLKKNKHPKGRYDLVPWDIIEQYVTGDAIMTSDLTKHQLDRVVTYEDLPLSEAHERIQRELGLTRALYAMEARGIKYDDGASLDAAAILEQQADEIEKGMPFKCNPTSAHAYFYGQLKLDPAMRKKKVDGHDQYVEAYTLDEEQVRSWVKDDVPWAKEFADVTKMRRAVSMWYRGYPEKIGSDGRLRCTYRQGQVKSGRMSVERVQLQAIPKKDKNLDGIPGVRDLILSEDGMALWNLDLSQAELRVATTYSKCQRMAEQLAKGMDSHGEVTKEVLHVMPDDPLWKEKRDIAKRLNFGGIFQIGGETFQATLAKLADIHLPLDECNRYVRGWRSMYPEYGTAYRRAESVAKQRGYVRVLPNTPYEIKSYFGPRDFHNTAWNRIVQGSLAEAFKMWLADIERRWPGYMVLTIHDSVLLEAREDEGDQVAEQIAAFGAELMTGLFAVEMKVDVDRW